MTSKRNILLGRITKLYGFEGAVTIKLEKDFSEDVYNLESVFLEIEGRPVPFFIEYAEPAGPLLIRMKFEGYDEADRIKEFVGCKVLNTSEKDIPAGINEDWAHDIMGYEVFSGENSIGRVADIIRNPAQMILEIKAGSGKSFLVPFHEDLIEEVDKDRRIIRMILPEGLSEIN